MVGYWRWPTMKEGCIVEEEKEYEGTLDKTLKLGRFVGIKKFEDDEKD
jgi:hypothetical protein